MPMTEKRKEKKGRGGGGKGVCVVGGGGGDENKAEGFRVGHFYWSFSSGVTSFVNIVRNGPCLGMIAIRIYVRNDVGTRHIVNVMWGGGGGGGGRNRANDSKFHVTTFITHKQSKNKISKAIRCVADTVKLSSSVIGSIERVVGTLFIVIVNH